MLGHVRNDSDNSQGVSIKRVFNGFQYLNHFTQGNHSGFCQRLRFVEIRLIVSEFNKILLGIKIYVSINLMKILPLTIYHAD